MAEWRHVERRDVDGSCRVTVGFDQYTDTCSCLTPTPDPASPCGYRRTPGECGETATSAWHVWNHSYQPTRCTCGHSIERVPPEGR